MFPLRLFQGACRGGTLALGEFHLGQATRRGETLGMKHPVPSNSAKVPHQGPMLIRGDRPDYFVGPALNDSWVNTCIAEEAQGVSDSGVVSFTRVKHRVIKNLRSARSLKALAKSGIGIPSIHRSSANQLEMVQPALTGKQSHTTNSSMCRVC